MRKNQSSPPNASPETSANKCPLCQQHMPYDTPNKDTATWKQVQHPGPLLCPHRQGDSIFRREYILGIHFSCFAPSISKPSVWGLEECSVHWHGISQSTTSDQEAHLIIDATQRRPYDHGIHKLHQRPYCPEAKNGGLAP